MLLTHIKFYVNQILLIIQSKKLEIHLLCTILNTKTRNLKIYPKLPRMELEVCFNSV